MKTDDPFAPIHPNVIIIRNLKLKKYIIHVYFLLIIARVYYYLINK